MRSPHYFIIRPQGGVRYDASKNLSGKDFIMSSSQEDHRYTNRVGIVIATPIGYTGEISEGDYVIVHHNVFRLYYDMKGVERSSWNFYEDDIFMVEFDQLFLYKKPEGNWSAPYPYCFIKPVLHENKEGELSSTDVELALHGYVEYVPSNDIVKKGDFISFRPESEYEFNIDGDKLYRMKMKNLCLKI